MPSDQPQLEKLDIKKIIIDYQINLTNFQFWVIQLFVCGAFIVGINLKNLFIGSIEKIIKNGMFLTVPFFILSLWALVYFSQYLFWVMSTVLLFCMSAGLIFYSLHRKAIEIPKATMGTIIAVFSSTMHLFGFLGSLAARKLYF